MSSRILGAGLFALALFSAPRPTGAEGKQFTATYEVTAWGTPVSFGFPAAQILVVNEGANAVYVNFTDTEPDREGFALRAGESVAVGPSRETAARSGIGLICAEGTTTVVRVLALL